ncbi:MAG TPA: helix-turn-helix domain-containing protein [Candidatus Acidoferrum sp.]|nr:helix-turn-helix domain-containing protein [Candidatus Acidoferrum sp.]
MNQKPKGTRKHRPLTADEKKRILARLRSGARQNATAREFGRDVSTIQEVRKAVGLRLFPLVTPKLEARILELRRAGTGLARTSKLTHVSERKILALSRAHGIRVRAGGVRLSEEKRAKIAAAVRRRESYCSDIAARFKVCKQTVLNIAHEIFGPGRLRSYPVWPPLQSRFPQKDVQDLVSQFVARHAANSESMPNVDGRESEETLFLLDLIVRKCCRGKLPDDHVGFAELVAQWCIQQIPRQTWDALGAEQKIVEHNFAIEFLTAAEVIRTGEAHKHDLVN